MFLDIALLVLVFYLAIPGSAGYFAHTRGYRFWPWFWLSFFFPFVAHFTLYLYVVIQERQARKDSKVLSPKEDRHMAAQIRKTMQEIQARLKRKEGSS